MGILAWVIEFFYWVLNALSPLVGFVPLRPTIKSPIIITTGGFTAVILYSKFKKYLEKKFNSVVNISKTPKEVTLRTTTSRGTKISPFLRMSYRLAA